MGGPGRRLRLTRLPRHGERAKVRVPLRKAEGEVQQVMTVAPSYVERLNGISRAEARSHTYFAAWAEVTPSDDVRALLRTVATREGDHAMAFAKRVSELGFEVEPRDDPNFADQMAIVTSGDLTDREKMEKLGFTSYFAAIDGGPDIFDNFFADHSVDPLTGELYGRFIAEERDTIRRLCDCYEQLLATEAAHGAARANDLRRVEAKIDRVASIVEELRHALRAQGTPSRNGERAERKRAS
jgi:rubrerythrin